MTTKCTSTLACPLWDGIGSLYPPLMAVANLLANRIMSSPSRFTSTLGSFLRGRVWVSQILPLCMSTNRTVASGGRISTMSSHRGTYHRLPLGSGSFGTGVVGQIFSSLTTSWCTPTVLTSSCRNSLCQKSSLSLKKLLILKPGCFWSLLGT